MAGEPIGLIAGGGQLPLLLARAARAAGLRVIAVGLKDETDPALAGEVDQFTPLSMGQLGKLIKTFGNAGVHRAIMGGSVGKARLFRDFWPDLRAISEFRKMKQRGDDSLLRGLAGVLEREGVVIQPAHEMVPELIAAEGVYTSRQPDRRERADLEIGWEVAGALGKLDIGQCVVVSKGVVTAVEAVEGTDRTIERGGMLAGRGAVVVKRSKPDQDLRFDLPAVGLDTIEALASFHCSCLAVEAGRTLVFDREEMSIQADRMGICVLAVNDQTLGASDNG